MSKIETKPRKRVEIRWDADDYQVLAERAALCDLTVSEFVRRATMTRPILTAADQKAVLELRRVAGMLKHLYPRNANWSNEEKWRYWDGRENLLAIAARIAGKK
ncbi:plasmid mobilization protein [Thiomonas sp.]